MTPYSPPLKGADPKSVTTGILALPRGGQGSPRRSRLGLPIGCKVGVEPAPRRAQSAYVFPTPSHSAQRSMGRGLVVGIRFVIEQGVAMHRLGFESLLASRPCPERDRVLAMVAARITAPHTKLATTRWWHTTTLAEDFGVAEASEDDLYAAMDWLLGRQDTI
jgi:hypothetical protein